MRSVGDALTFTTRRKKKRRISRSRIYDTERYIDLRKFSRIRRKKKDSDSSLVFLKREISVEMYLYINCSQSRKNENKIQDFFFLIFRYTYVSYHKLISDNEKMNTRVARFTWPF